MTFLIAAFFGNHTFNSRLSRPTSTLTHEKESALAPFPSVIGIDGQDEGDGDGNDDSDGIDDGDDDDGNDGDDDQEGEESKAISR